MVAHNGSDYLPRTLAALAGTDPAGGHRDRGGYRITGQFGCPPAARPRRSQCHHRQRRQVRDGRRRAAPALPPWPRGTGGARRTGSEWIWLLHDDAAPAPEALAELLHAVERAPSVTVAGCKQLDWNAERRLIDVGLSTSRWAERLTLIEADELDQGQYDGRSDTFAVNSAGMLVRRDIWEHLKGFDPALPGTRRRRRLLLAEPAGRAPGGGGSQREDVPRLPPAARPGHGLGRTPGTGSPAAQARPAVGAAAARCRRPPGEPLPAGLQHRREGSRATAFRSFWPPRRPWPGPPPSSAGGATLPAPAASAGPWSKPCRPNGAKCGATGAP